jgi:hypothetical protein
MSTVAEAADKLTAALKTVSKIRVISDGNASLDPPCALLGPPQLDRSAYSRSWTSATFVVLLAVPADDRATDRLWGLIGEVADAIESEVDAVVQAAFPVSVAASSGADLPAYQLQVEMSL